MLLRINNDGGLYNIHHVADFTVNHCEVIITFKCNHKYSNINDIIADLQAAGLHIGNYYFKGVEAFAFYVEDGKYYTLDDYDENGQTSVLCIIPQNLRGTLQFTAAED
jgi:hypothetical protein